MPRKTPTRPASKQPRSSERQQPLPAWNDPLKPQQPLVSGRWLLSAIGIVVAAAVLCAYAAFCLLFYQGSWQLIFHPSRTVGRTPSSIGIRFEDVRFNYTETGKPQLAGWWVPAGDSARYSATTILLLHDSKGSLSDTIDQIQVLHALGINLLVFDYRGFGQSADLRPSEQKMNADADAAWTYLTDTRHISPGSIVIYGIGLGANLAASTASRHPASPALIFEDLSPDALALLARDPRSHLVPVRLLTQDRFNAETPLQSLKTPKVFLEGNTGSQTEKLFHTAAYPKELFQLRQGDPASYLDTLQRFLDESLAHP